MSGHPSRGYKPALDLAAGDFESLRRREALRDHAPRDHAPRDKRSKQRAQLRERMSAWGRRVSPRLSSLGIESEVELSEEDGAEVLRFVTHEGVLALRVDARAVEVGLELPRVTIDSTVAESRLLASLESLPEQFVVRAKGREILAQAASADVIEESATWIGWTVPREVAIEHAELLDDQLEDALAALAGVLTITAPNKPARASSRPRLSTSATRRARSPLLAKGAEVQVLHGPFAGKTGVIVELDGKGIARVALGLLEARLPVSDLALAEGGRPKLGTSHRRVTLR